MFKIEEKIKKYIEDKLNVFFLLIITSLAVVIRVSGFGFISNDMYKFLIPWFKEIKSGGGIAVLDRQVGDYNLLYQTIISFFTYLDIDCVYLYKILSCIFDFPLAIACGRLVCSVNNKNWRNSREFYVIYSGVLFVPTVFLNSSYWGQCDSIYTFFIVLTVYKLLNEKYISAFISLGICFGFKLQAVFIIPFIIFLYFRKKNMSILHFTITLASFWLTGIVAFIKGRNVMDIFTIYADQTGIYKEMYLNTASFWKLVGNEYTIMNDFAILFTVAILGIALYLYILKSSKEQTKEDHILVAVWTMWTVLMFLPSMHERYTYPLDIMLLILCAINMKYIVIAASEILISTMTYGFYLFSNGYQTDMMSVVNLGLYFIISFVFIRKIIFQKNLCIAKNIV